MPKLKIRAIRYRRTDGLTLNLEKLNSVALLHNCLYDCIPGKQFSPCILLTLSRPEIKNTIKLKPSI